MTSQLRAYFYMCKRGAMLCLNFACTCVTRLIRNYGVNEFFADKVIVTLISARGNKRNMHARACDAEDTRHEGRGESHSCRVYCESRACAWIFLFLLSLAESRATHNLWITNKMARSRSCRLTPTKRPCFHLFSFHFVDSAGRWLAYKSHATFSCSQSEGNAKPVLTWFSRAYPTTFSLLWLAHRFSVVIFFSSWS